MVPDFDAVFEKGPYFYAAKEIQGISTRTYMENMRTFLEYLK
jgi:hypothetical protein